MTKETFALNEAFAFHSATQIDVSVPTIKMRCINGQAVGADHGADDGADVGDEYVAVQ